MRTRIPAAMILSLLWSVPAQASPVYYVFDGALTFISDSAGLAADRGLTVGSTFRTVFLVDTDGIGTETRLSNYPFPNQRYTTELNDRDLAGGVHLDYFYADLISQPLLQGDAWSDLGTIEKNYGYFQLDPVLTVNSFRLFGANSPDTTGDETRLETSYQDLVELTLGKEFLFYEQAARQSGSGTVQTSLYGRVNLVAVTDIYPVPVPVPGVAWLFGAGILGFVGWGRRRTGGRLQASAIDS